MHNHSKTADNDASSSIGWALFFNMGFTFIEFVGGRLTNWNDGLAVAGRSSGCKFFKRLLRNHGEETRKIVTDNLRRYGVAHRELIPEVIHSTKQYENNRVEQFHEATRVRERGMRRSDVSKFKSNMEAKRFLSTHAVVSSLFNLGRHLVKAEHFGILSVSGFYGWIRAVACVKRPDLRL